MYVLFSVWAVELYSMIHFAMLFASAYMEKKKNSFTLILS